jgi:drug/metabolite transporter (DMT)-like permease
MASVALYALLCVIWGSTWMVIKVGYGGLGPFTVAALRFLLAGALLTAMVPVLKARWPRGRTEWFVVVFVGVVLFGADYGLIYWGEQFIDSGLTAILFATLPLFTVALAHLYVPGDRLTARKLAGTLLAFLGVVALFGESLRLDTATLAPMAAVILATVCAAMAGVVSKRHGTTLDAATLNAPAMIIGGLVLLAVAVAAGERVRLPDDANTWTAIGYLALVGSVVSFLVYFSLLKTWSVTSLSFISVFTPAIALVLGFVFLGERPTLWTGLGAMLILAGVALALTKATPTSQPPTTNHSQHPAAKVS